ncbi:MAG: DNA polymerase III subunit alpha [Candidatus Harrisonbacteria bacterium CG10_big_fil_rev_8_21_14_0_10_45_28]|uniref:DNA polymerase III subunit alpha n=1 Tax=Candidatus Harrisonbacteria bacterium CG10_big_fil_rev_8_21_14_0_10_45_28 TaxID=1974586 RepID=A0A2H0UPE1_9BACT|nr:MAG: DNA polymerase III subunit alpha [Candidatus Harrisonbacteria bacterium CG10_big_fil_rev_8_21_14_0_10_45_28]
MSKFVHLHTHSHYSLLDGMSKIAELVKKAKADGQTSLAVTDHGNLYGAIELYKEATKAGIKPILGVEAYIAPGDCREKNGGASEERYYHLVLLAKNETGWKNLIQLVTKSNLEGFYYKPRMDKAMLREHSEGLIALSGCLGGELSQALLNNRVEDAEAVAKEYQEIFGKENYFIEVGKHPAIPDSEKVEAGLVGLAERLGIDVVATRDSHYLEKEDRPVHDILLCIQTGRTMEDEKRFKLEDEFHFSTQEEMTNDFAFLPEAIDNTTKIADMCNVELELGKILLPKFAVPSDGDKPRPDESGRETEDGKDSVEFLKNLVSKKIGARYDNPEDEKVVARMEYELRVIGEMGFADYFLIVQDFINWSKERGIVVGPGRGSAAGSIISYILGITDLDPLKYDLLFERFLNPSRIQMPDIDIDIADTRRDEVFGYLTEKYGESHVAHIITFGTMAARAAIRDVGRALNIELPFCDHLAKLIPFGKNLEQSLKIVPELYDLYKKDNKAKQIIDAAKRLEGVARHASVHACGTVIGADPLTDRVPLQYSPQKDNIIVTQFEMHAIEDLGLLKMDLLGLKNLTIIENALRLIEDKSGEKIDISKIPLDDRKAFELFQQADTVGVFQLESGGMRRYLKDLKPTELEDIIAMVALYRPGPMELIPSYIARKFGKEEVSYIHPRLEPILKNTYGIGIYQEQMMRIASDMAGYSLAEADTLRKAIGKKIKKLLDQQEEKLVSGLIANGIPEATAKRIWDLFPPFARYGFNRCLTGDTLIQDIKSGRLISIDQLRKNRGLMNSTVSLNESSKKIYSNKIVEVIENGKKPVFEIRLQSGRTIKATGNHPFLTSGGWRLLKDIDLKEKIATPRTLPSATTPVLAEEHKLAVLGYLIAEGNLCHPHGFYFYSKSEAELSDYISSLEMFKNTTATLNRAKSAVSVYSKRTDVKYPSEAVEWIRSLGIYGKRATEKEFPDIVFGLSNEQLAIVLAKYFQGDGCISRRKYAEIFFATSSKKLSSQIQHLLLRFGILSSIRNKKFKYRGLIKPGFVVYVSRYDNIEKFLNAVIPHLVGEKLNEAKKVMLQHPIINGSLKTWVARGSKDVIPVTLALSAMREAVSANNIPFRAATRQYGFAEHLLFSDKRKIGVLRETVNYFSQAFSSATCRRLANSDIYWDGVASVTPVGAEPTYDLSMEKDHNFVANDIFVHNSHAASYAMIAYRTAYLKANYPVEFMTALFNADSGDVERIAYLIGECKKMKIEVLAPDVNKSSSVFTPEGKNIRFGMAAIKNVGNAIVEAIVEERTKSGEFENFTGFVTRVKHKDLNKKSLESLVKCGALDCFGIERNTLLENIEAITKFIQTARKELASNQANLFGNVFDSNISTSALDLKPAKPATGKEKLAWEKELLGLYVSEHPLQLAMEQIAGTKSTPIREMLAERSTSRSYRLAGMIASMKSIITKTGKPMAFVKLEDLSGSVEMVVFPDVFTEKKDIFVDGNVVVVLGRLSFRNNEASIICEGIKVLE